MPLTKVKSGGVSDSITLTSPDINAPDIDGGTIDNAVIGGSTAAAGSFTTITATGGSSSNWNTAYGWGDHSTQSYATQTYVGTAVSNLVDSSPAALDTLNELAAALGDDPNFATTVTNSIALKAPLASPSFTGTATMDGLDVDGTITAYGLNFDVSDGVEINALESIVFDIDSDNNQTSRVFQVKANNSTPLLTIAEAGNVGIGEADPDSTLTVKGASHTNFQVKSNSESTKAFIQTVQDSDVRIGSSTNHPVSLYQNGAERMRIDSSGNLLVGKTSTDNTTAGTRIHPLGYASFTIANDYPIIANRLSSDGAIAVFRKDGADVGSIGVHSSSLQIGTGNTQIKFSDAEDSFYVVNAAGVARDNSHDLGKTGARFKDLYLSGGVYLGGTGAANKLDSYEEGTWTPNIKAVGGTTSATFSSVGSTYTKVGRLVTLNTYIYNINYSGITDGTYIVISNLPFAAGDNYGGSCLAYANGDVESVYLNRFTDYAYLCNDTNGNEFLQNNTNPTTTKFMATIIYQTA